MDLFTRYWIIVSAMLLLTFSNCRAQQSELLDSLAAELKIAETDSARQYWLGRLTWYNIANNTAGARQYNKRARDIALLRGDSLGVARTFHYDGMIDRFAGNYPEAIAHLNTALRYYESVSYESGIAGAVFNLGVVYSFIGDYERSLECYYRQKDIHEKHGTEFEIANTLNSIASVQRKMGNYSEAMELYDEAYAILENSERLWDITNVISNKGALYLEMGKLNEAEPYFRRALENNRQIGDSWGIGYSLLRLGVLKHKLGELDSADHFLSQSVVVRRELDQKLEYAESLVAHGAVLFDLGQQSESIDQIHDALAISEEIGVLESQSNAHDILAGFYFQTGQPARAYEHLRDYTTLRDSAVSVEKQRITRNLEARYESERKDRALAERELRIAANENQIQRQRYIIWISVAGFVALLIILISVYVAFRSRRKLNEQKLQNLISERELVALKSMMVGEEKERARIARELHDGLSSFLAAIKIQFSSIQQDSAAFQSDEKFNEAMKRLDEANTEVRRIAHNMMPEILMKYGMEVALSEFVAGLNTGNDLKVELSHFGMEERLPSGVELVLYRVVQELLSNVIKHSRASEVLVQLNRRGSQLSITVEDNGMGFDESMMSDSRGMGIHNLTSRIQYLNGEVNFESSRDKGTSVYIEVDLDKIPEAV